MWLRARNLKPKDGSHRKRVGQSSGKHWSRDELRYIKDSPLLMLVGLPEDRARVEEDETRNQDEEMNKQERIIQNDRQRGLLRYVNMEPEEDVPFLQLIKMPNKDQSSNKKGKSIYNLKEAIQLVKKLSGFVHLLHGFGKAYRVAVFAASRDAGADIVGGPELVEDIRTD